MVVVSCDLEAFKPSYLSIFAYPSLPYHFLPFSFEFAHPPHASQCHSIMTIHFIFTPTWFWSGSPGLRGGGRHSETMPTEISEHEFFYAGSVLMVLVDVTGVTLYSFLPISCHAARRPNGQGCSHHTYVTVHEKKAEVDRRHAQNVHLFYFSKKKL